MLVGGVESRPQRVVCGRRWGMAASPDPKPLEGAELEAPGGARSRRVSQTSHGLLWPAPSHSDFRLCPLAVPVPASFPALRGPRSEVRVDRGLCGLRRDVRRHWASLSSERQDCVPVPMCTPVYDNMR